MEIRVTRPELYLECDDPTDVERRQGYYPRGNSLENCLENFFSNNKLIQPGEVVDVQNDLGQYEGTYRQNVNGQIVKLPHSLHALNLLEELLSICEPISDELSNIQRDDFKRISAECADLRSGVDV